MTQDQNKGRRIFRISEINQDIAQTLEEAFPSLWLKGELSNFNAHSSGHWYFSLKDEGAQIRGVMFRGSNQRIHFSPENGMELLVRGRISVYPPRGTYQILCQEMELAGSGSLQAQFEELKRKLRAEGLFDEARKKPIPPLPRQIAIITSPTGAAIQDMLQILKRRFSGARILIIPSLAQGAEAPAQLIAGLKKAWQLPGIDTLIIGRGGGSMEDLWAFNDEGLARAISRSPIPVISAVGHETDFAICDFVADLRAPTPSAAAELVAQSAESLLERCAKIQKQLIQGMDWQFKLLRERIQGLERRLISPERLLRDRAQRTDELTAALHRAAKNMLQRERERLAGLENLLQSLNPRQLMRKGFCLAKGKDSELITDSRQISLEDKISLEFFKGGAEALVVKKNDK